MANYSKNLYSKLSIKKDNTPSPLFIYHITSPLRMKKTVLLTLFFLCSATLFAHTVKGVLTEEETGEAQKGQQEQSNAGPAQPQQKPSGTEWLEPVNDDTYNALKQHK